MSRRVFLLLLAVCLMARGAASADELYDLYTGKDFFTLVERLPGLRADDPRRAFFAGQVDAAFLRDQQAESALRKFVATESADTEWRREAWLTLGNARLRRGAYADAAQALAEALRGSPANFSAARRLDAEQNLVVARALAAVPAQTTSARGPAVRLPVIRDSFGLLHIDVRINGRPTRGMFDTLANGNVASENFARQHGLRMLDGSIALQAITGKTLPARVGVADEAQIGGVTCRNVVFTILPGRSLDLPGSGDDSSLIIGLPLIMALERVRFDAARGELEVGGGGASAKTAPNLAFDGLTPLVRANFQRQALPFALDTGMQDSKLSVRFGERFPQMLAVAKPRTDRQLGVGSSTLLWVKVVPTLELTVGGTRRRLDGVPMLTEDMSFLPSVFGALGADFVQDGFELDFRRMRFSFGP